MTAPTHRTTGARVVCIAGMHRSGTSMVTRLLNLCGVDLGPEDQLLAGPDNPEGHWESQLFFDVNESILAARGGTWDAPPPATPGWFEAPELAPVRDAAAALVRRFEGREPWGWKDPRNSVTLPFWRSILPTLKVVVCVRNPLEVVDSLQTRGDAVCATGLDLWLAYYERLLEAAPAAERIVTHYDAYFDHPRAELRRVAGWLGLDPDDEMLSRALAFAKAQHRHHRTTTTDLLRQVADPGVVRCYMRLCAEAGPVCEATLESQRMGHVPESLPELNERHLSALARRRVVRLEEEAAARTHELAVREEELAARTRELAARADEVAAGARQIAALESQVHDLDARLEAISARAAGAEAAVAAQVERTRQLTGELEVITSSRGWRLLEMLWRIRLRLAPTASRRERALARLARAFAASSR